MTHAILDPLRLDVAAFAAGHGELSGVWALAALPRLADEMSQAGGEVAWRAHGRQVARAGQSPEVWLDLNADAIVPLSCQRCLKTVELPLAVRRSFRFVADEAEAERLDDEMEDDVLVIQPRFDLRALVEDELLLHLPIVPRHEICPEPLPVADDPLAEPENPFAQLAQLRQRRLDG